VSESVRRAGTFFSPRRVLAVLAVLVVIAALLAPLPETAEAPGLSSFGAGPGGARGLYETLNRLGFRVDRALGPMRGELDPDAVWFVLAPEIQPTATEVHRLLDAVRAGAGLVVLPETGSRLADSLGMRRAPVVPLPGRGGRAQRDSIAYGRGLIAWVLRPLESAQDTVLTTTTGVRWFLSVATRYGTEPVVLGRTLGRGRIIVAANADLFSNAAVRDGEPAVRVVRLIEWLLEDAGAGRTLRFDEYHHGFGTQASVTKVARRALLHTPAGRTALMLAVAAVVLLIAAGTRPIPPLPRQRIERRSPLEHVAALARAYREARANDRAVRLLVRGVRRRHGGIQPRLDDAAWLRVLAERHPSVAHDIDTLLAGMGARDGPQAPAGIAAAIRNIEQVVSP
jgi:hypothetical protein